MTAVAAGIFTQPLHTEQAMTWYSATYHKDMNEHHAGSKIILFDKEVQAMIGRLA